MPLRALSIAVTGGRAMMQKVDTIANNLANVDTVGYKKARANFADLLYQHVQRAGFGDPGRNQNPTGLFFGTGVRLSSTEKIHSQGALGQTERPLDWAIDGEGYFQITLPNGTVAYTRGGNFERDSEGTVITSDGYPLQPTLQIPENIIGISVDPTGIVSGFDPSNPDTLQELGQIQLFRFVNASGLSAIGDNLYQETPASGNPVQGQPGLEQFGQIRQGFLERSNVDIVQELVELITAQRSFEINTTSIRASDEILQTVNNLRR